VFVGTFAPAILCFACLWLICITTANTVAFRNPAVRVPASVTAKRFLIWKQFKFTNQAPTVNAFYFVRFNAVSVSSLTIASQAFERPL
jgi:hypothetical protein